MKKRILRVFMTLLLLAGMFTAGRGGARLVASQSQVNEKLVVIDAGHGGDDPGKVGVHQEQEKEINLQIAKLLQKKLEEEGIHVVMTRESDADLADVDASNKKAQSLKRRCELIEQVQPACVVSIHQNSYPDASVKGAQVFYYSQSQEGQKMAEILQEHLVQGLDPENHRKAKGNDSYYMLKKTVRPTVIVECGFLSNAEEASLLASEEYQKKVAIVICQGILEYLGSFDNTNQQKDGNE